MLESIKTFLAFNVFSTLQGASLGDWWRELTRNRFRISPRYLLRAGLVSISAPVNSFFASRVNRKHGAAIAATEIRQPIIILGHWRSDTTLLQRLFALDSRYCYPTFYECVFPRGFISSEKMNGPFYNLFLPKNRLFDNMSNGFHSPAEDEFAIAVLCGLSPYMGWCFPRNQDHYDKYLTFANASDAERRRWKETLVDFARRLVYYHQKPVVLKSPTHTGRIKMLLETFPDAKFVHIHRDPLTVFSSTKKMLVSFTKSTKLQAYDAGNIDDRIIRNYRMMYDAYLAEKHLIPEGQFHEIGFDALEKEPLETLRTIYGKLGLPDFTVVEPAVQGYLDSVKGYQKNKYEVLPPELDARLRAEWAPYIKAWGYGT